MDNFSAFVRVYVNFLKIYIDIYQDETYCFNEYKICVLFHSRFSSLGVINKKTEI